MTDVDFEIITTDGTIPAVALLENPYNLTRGETLSATFRFENRTPSLTVASGETYIVASGTRESYGTVTIESDATLTVESNAVLNAGTINIQTGGTLDQELNSTVNEDGYTLTWRLLQDYEEHAGAYSVNETLQNSQKFRQNLPSELESLVVGIRPKQSLQDRDVDGVWGLISGVTDQRNAALNEVQYELSIQILADRSQYSTLTDVETDLEITI